MAHSHDILLEDKDPASASAGHLSVRQEWILIAVLASINFTHIMDFVIMMPLGPQLTRVFQINTQQFSFIVSSYTFSAAFSGIVSSLFIDRFDRKTALLFFYAGFIVGTSLCALAPTFALLIGARIVAGAFGGVAGGLVFAIIGDTIPSARRGRALGTVMASFSVASIVGVPLGLYFATRLSWHAPFVGLAIMGSLVFLVGLRIMPSLTSHLAEAKKKSPLQEMRAILSEANHLRAFSLTTMIMLAGFSVIPFLSQYMVRNVGLTEAQLPFLYLCGGCFTFFTSQWFGRLADIYGKHRVFYILAICSLIPILITTNLPPMPLVLALCTSTLFMIFVSGRFVPAMALIAGSTIPSQRGGFMSINASIQQGAAGLAAGIAGIFLNEAGNGPIHGFGRVGIFACGATLCCLYLAKKIKLRT